MRIDSISSAGAMLRAQPLTAETGGQPQTSFAEALEKSIGEVNRLQTEADGLASKVAGGDLSATHQAIVSMEKASLALDLTVQVRNKAIEAYQELMRTQA